jgi:murein DD-endopeptidase MepM/ murein hydrolase activator NlpD
MQQRLLLILPALFCSFNADAKTLYKYLDEQGHWHYSDRSPGANVQAETSQLADQSREGVKLLQSNTGGLSDYYVRNDYPGPVEVEISLVQNRNIRTEPQLPARFTVMPGESEPLVHLFPLNPFQDSLFELQSRYVLGSPAAHHDASVLYLPPFDGNGRFLITQGFDGKISHQDLQNKYAVDIAMPVGTPVYAARGGVLIRIENDFSESGMKEGLIPRSNNICILHDDGSIGVYAHLSLKAAQVFPGATVADGQLIAYSGNTGFSSGPHLHFAVQVNRGMELMSVPFKFASDKREALNPVQGMWLRGVKKTE